MIVAWWLFASLFMQSAGVAYDPQIGPLFSSVSLDHIYNETYESIRAVDFRNRTVQIFDEKGHPGNFAGLKNGKYAKRDARSEESVELMAIEYLDPPISSGQQHALILFDWFSVGGSSSKEGVAQVFVLSRGRLKVIQQFSWDEHFITREPYHRYDSRAKTLTVCSAHYLPGDAHCCVSAMDVITLRWNESRFDQTDFKTELSENGKREGKTLQD
jgi:hypothetical protein